MDNKKWLENRFLDPVVIVAGTDECEETCQRNGVSLIQLLKPFEKSTQVIHTCTGKDVSHQQAVTNFGVRFFRPDGVKEMDPKTRVEHFCAVMKEHSKTELANGAQLNAVIDQICSQRENLSSPKLDAFAGKTLVGKTYVPWHDNFVQDYTSVVRCSYFDCVDHPVGFVFGISTAGGPELVIRRLNEIARVKDKFFQTMGIPAMDQEVHVFYLIVHDVREGCGPNECKEIFESVKRSVGASFCALLEINSNMSEHTEVSPQRWIESNKLVDCYATTAKRDEPKLIYSLPNAADGKLVSCLTENDVNNIQNVLNKYFQAQLVPWIANKLIKLMEIVEKKKTTTFSKMAAWFRSDDDKKKDKGETTFVSVGDGGPKRYLPHAVEVVMRRAGDLFMNLRDYENALKYLRIAREELKLTLADRPFNKHLIAAAQEAISICFYFQGRLPLPCGPRENDCRLEEARNMYTHAGVQSYAFRCSLILMAMCRNRVTPENSRALILTHSALRTGSLQANRCYSAVLHEMCANFVLVANPPMAGNNPEIPLSVPNGYNFFCNVRKYSRYLSIAGAAYMDIGMYDQSMKCYLLALTVQTKLGGKTWSSLMEAIITQLSVLFLQNNEPAKALGLMCVAARDGTPMFRARHAKYSIDAFLAQVKAFLVQRCISYLPHMMLPRVHAPKISVVVNTFSEDETTLEEVAFVGPAVMDTEWKAMEENLRTALQNNKSPLSLPMKSKKKASSGQNKHAAGGGSGRHVEHYHTLIGEIAWVKVPFTNNTSCELKLDNVRLIYRPHQSPPGKAAGGAVLTDSQNQTQQEELAASQQERKEKLMFADPVPFFVLAPLQSLTAALPFVDSNAGTYDVVGLQWELQGVSSRVYFANTIADEADPMHCKLLDQVDSFAKACEDPFPPLVSPLHIQVVVDGAAANVTMRFDPPLPTKARDGYTYRGNLVLTNQSALCTATSLAILRSEANAHLLYFPDFEKEDNEALSAPLFLNNIKKKGQQPAEDVSIAPNSEFSCRVVYRAQLDHNVLLSVSDSNTSNLQQQQLKSINYVPLLLSYATEHKDEILPSGSSKTLRLHKCLRHVTVTPSVVVRSTMVPPTLPPSEPAQEPASAPPATNAEEHAKKMKQKRLTPHFSSVLEITNCSNRLEPPMRILRGIASSSDWEVQPVNKAAYAAEGGIGCLLTQTQKLFVPVQICRDQEKLSSASSSLAKKVSGEEVFLNASGPLSEAQLEQFQSDVGSNVCNSEEMMYFVAKGVSKGAGKIGVEEAADGEWAFFVDGAGGKDGQDGGGGNGDGTSGTEDSGSILARHHQQHPLVNYSPILVSIAWVATEGGGHQFGQVFTFVNPLIAAQRLGSTSADWRPKSTVELAVKHAPHWGLPVLVDHFTNKTTIDSKRGMVHYNPVGLEKRLSFPVLTDPAVASSTSAKSPARGGAFEPLVHRFQVAITSFSVQPVLVEVTAKMPSCNSFNPQQLFHFVGQTKSQCTLRPDETKVLNFAVVFSAPGHYNLNSFEVRATPIKYVLDNTGHKKSLLDRVFVMGTAVPWSCCVAEDTNASPIASPVGGSVAPFSSATASKQQQARTRSQTTVQPVSAARPITRQRTTTITKASTPTLPQRRGHSRTVVNVVAAGGGGGASPTATNSLLASLATFQQSGGAAASLNDTTTSSLEQTMNGESAPVVAAPAAATAAVSASEQKPTTTAAAENHHEHDTHQTTKPHENKQPPASSSSDENVEEEEDTSSEDQGASPAQSGGNVTAQKFHMDPEAAAALLGELGVIASPQGGESTTLHHGGGVGAAGGFNGSPQEGVAFISAPLVEASPGAAEDKDETGSQVSSQSEEANELVIDAGGATPSFPHASPEPENTETAATMDDGEEESTAETRTEGSSASPTTSKTEEGSPEPNTHVTAAPASAASPVRNNADIFDEIVAAQEKEVPASSTPQPAVQATKSTGVFSSDLDESSDDDSSTSTGEDSTIERKDPLAATASATGGGAAAAGGGAATGGGAAAAGGASPPANASFGVSPAPASAGPRFRASSQFSKKKNAEGNSRSRTGSGSGSDSSSVTSSDDEKPAPVSM